MPIRSRGELPDPRITAVRDCFSRPASTTINTEAYIALTIDAPNCQLYFTTDGSRPVPFKRWMGDREVTFRYTAPFALKSGKRVVRAVAVSSDGLLESTVVSKTFMVRGNDYDTIDSDLYSDEDYMSHTSDVNWNSDVTGRSRDRSGTRRSWTPCKTWTQGRQSRSLSRPVSAEPNWIASTRRYPYLVDTVDGEDRTGQSVCWSDLGSGGSQRETRGQRFDYRRVPSIPSTTQALRSTCGGPRPGVYGPLRLGWSPTPTLPPPCRAPRTPTRYSLDY